MSQSDDGIINHNCPANDAHTARRGHWECVYALFVWDILCVYGCVTYLFIFVLVCVRVCTAIHIISISILLTWSCSSQSEFSVLSAGVVSLLWDLSKWQGTPHSKTAAFILLALYSLSFWSTHAHTHWWSITCLFIAMYPHPFLQCNIQCINLDNKQVLPPWCCWCSRILTTVDNCVAGWSQPGQNLWAHACGHRWERDEWLTITSLATTPNDNLAPPIIFPEVITEGVILTEMNLDTKSGNLTLTMY